MTINEVIVLLNQFSTGVGTSFNKLLTRVSNVETSVSNKVDTTGLNAAVNGAIAANATVTGLGTRMAAVESLTANTTALDMKKAFNDVVTDANYKIA